MALLPLLPKPTASSELVKSIGILRERALQAHRERKPSAKQVASSPQIPVEQPRSSLLVPVLAAPIAVVLAAGGYLAYQRVTAKDGTETAFGKVTGKSAQTRPAWIVVDAHTPA